ncbi:LacI family DNA-binding transcriptional regulator [Arcanobacterium canis]|uniref:LacI family DNA-binding transcriptional regulator n=1 Tax=Arcanobacterium canis TaxID=999183 RepID=A0ABY8FZ03_9ACTO|nr:LacI family DNA-binding transcriptional regulator [Arcanobacterium canis]WFM83447.1 LacI family DNA-binding transcriptional regulator [Arcanobacterium canis]
MSNHVVMADVARLAGVSSQTVSRVLSGKESVSATTKEKVLRAIETLQYQPNFAASTLASGTSSMVGVLMLGKLSFGRADSYLQLVQLQSDRGNFVTALSVDPSDFSALQRAVSFFVAAKVQAIVVMGQSVRAVRELCHSIHFPWIVVVNGELPEGDFVAVQMEQRGSTREMLEHLHAASDGVIVHVSPGVEDVDAHLRRETYLEYCDAVGMDPLVIHVPDWSAHSGEIGAKALSNVTYSGVFAANDHIALGVAKGLRSQGREPGRDYVLGGFDDTQISQLAVPTLTTVRQKYDVLAQIISQQIDRVIHGETTQNVVLPNELVIRQSSVLTR